MSESIAYNSRTKTGKLKWRPKQWRTEYDRIVAYSALGRSNTWIAEQLQFTPEHVSSILNMPEAHSLMQKLQAKLREKMAMDIPMELMKISETAMKRVKEVLTDDELAKKAPFMMLDRSLDVLKGVGHLRGGGNGAPVQSGPVTNIGTVVLAPNHLAAISAGLERIAEVKQINSGNDNSNSK